MCLSACQSSSMIDESNNSILDSDTNVIVKSEFEKLFTESDKSYESADIESNDVKKEFSESVEPKAYQPKGETSGIIDKGSEAAISVILHDNNVYDYWFFDGTEESLILSSSVGNAGFCKKNILRRRDRKSVV